MANLDDVHVDKIESTEYHVTVEGATTTEHDVHLDPVYYEKLTGGDVPPEQLVTKSFEFLLEREPNTAILREFELPDITNYFPEFESEIQSTLQKNGD